MPKTQSAPLSKRLLAIVYDSLIVFFIALIIVLIVQQVILQFELVNLEQVQINKKGEKINAIPANSPATYFLRSLWFFISFIYFSFYWTKRGQTLGMKVWKIKVVNQQGGLISWFQSLIRYSTALLGLGLLIIALNKPRQALQDILSKTQLIIHG